MNGTSLTVANVTTLSSKELTVELFNIMNAINEGNKSAWEVARAYKRIIDDELFDEDFENVQELHSMWEYQSLQLVSTSRLLSL